MAGLRSPNYPNVGLNGALALARVIFDKDHQNKVAREVVAAHLGHDGLTGPALGKIGALRAYGLLDGSGNELRISDDAMSAMLDPPESQERKEALKRLAFRPVLFRNIRAAFPSNPSDESLNAWLRKQGFTDSASWIAAKSYRETIELAGSETPSYDSTETAATTPGKPQSYNPLMAATTLQRQVTGIMEGERELTTGMLSKTAGFRLIVNGAIGVKEIERLIAKLELDKEILAEADADADKTDS